MSVAAPEPVPATRRRLPSRRVFLGAAGLSALAAGGYYASRDRIRLGLIGCGVRGNALAQVIRMHGAAAWRHGTVVALVDVVPAKAEALRDKYASGADTYTDYRKMVERPDIDAIVIASPDHWHAAMALAGFRAGKGVFLEKPMTNNIAEALVLRDEGKRAGRPFMLGTLQRSTWYFRAQAELARSGRLGAVRTAEVRLGTKRPMPPGPYPTEPVPPGLDWELFCGPAPLAPYHTIRQKTFSRYWATGGGDMTGWGSHHLDCAMWAMDLLGTVPTTVTGGGTIPGPDDGYEIPGDQTGRFEFSDGRMITLDTLPENPNVSGLMLKGETSDLWANRSELVGPAADGLSSNPLPASASLHPTTAKKTLTTVRHMAHFYDVFRDEAQPVSDLASSVAPTIALHLANISMRVGRPVRWDPVTELIVGDPQAAAMINPPRRPGYELL